MTGQVLKGQPGKLYPASVLNNTFKLTTGIQEFAPLLLVEGLPLVERIAERRLRPLDELTPGARERLEQTGLAYISHRGNAAATARALHLHPQTVRYRLGRLRELLGESLDDPDAHFELEAALRSRAWSREHGYGGYTSYASLDDLPQRMSVFADLKSRLDRHAKAFAEALSLDLRGGRLRLDSLWVNVLKPGAGHSGHIHPHSVISGTVYVATPPGASALKLEDPRLPLMMAAPTRPDSFVAVEPRPGLLLMWESWLRHEVLPGKGTGERLSISFNFA